MGDCTPCVPPSNAATGSPTCSSCLATYYRVPGVADTAAPSEMCELCPPGSTCTYTHNDTEAPAGSLIGYSLSNIRLEPRHWRFNENVKTVTRCLHSATSEGPCVGGDVAGPYGELYCREGHYGPLCQLCANSSRYFDEGRWLDQNNSLLNLLPKWLLAATSAIGLRLIF